MPSYLEQKSHSSNHLLFYTTKHGLDQQLQQSMSMANLKLVRPQTHHAEQTPRQNKTEEEYHHDMEELRRIDSKSIEQLSDQMKCVKHVVHYHHPTDHTLTARSTASTKTSSHPLKPQTSIGGLEKRQN